MTKKEVFEVLWPRTLAEAELNPEDLFKKYAEAYRSLSPERQSSLGPKLLEMSRYLFEEEAGRRLRLEGTSATLLNVLGVMAALVVGLAGILVASRESTIGVLGITVVLGYTLSLLCLFGAFLHALRVFSHEARYCLDPTDLQPCENESESEWSLRLSRRFLEYTVENYKVNNKQVNRLQVSRILFRNAVVLLLITGVLLGVSTVRGSGALGVQGSGESQGLKCQASFY